MDKLLDFLHLSLGDKSKREESEPQSTAGSLTPNTDKKSVFIDKSFQFPECEEPLQAGGPTVAGVGQNTPHQEESQESQDGEENTLEMRKPGKNVAVKNLPRQLKKGELEKILSAGPKPKNITFVRNNGKFHGMVLIKYPTAQDAAEAVSALNGTLVKGKPIIVEYKKKTKKDKPKEDNKLSESESATESPQVSSSQAHVESKSDSEKVEPVEQFIPFRRHSIAYPNSAWRRNSSFSGYDAGKSAMAFRRNSIACFAPDPHSCIEILPAFSPVRQPKGPIETSKGFSDQSRRASLASE
jgi:RNA recognition motif-containing protein